MLRGISPDWVLVLCEPVLLLSFFPFLSQRTRHIVCTLNAMGMVMVMGMVMGWDGDVMVKKTEQMLWKSDTVG